MSETHVELWLVVIYGEADYKARGHLLDSLCFSKAKRCSKTKPCLEYNIGCLEKSRFFSITSIPAAAAAAVAAAE